MPSQGISNVDLDGVLEVRALVEAIYSNEKIARETSVESFVVANNHGGRYRSKGQHFAFIFCGRWSMPKSIGIDPNGQAQRLRVLQAAPQIRTQGRHILCLL